MSGENIAKSSNQSIDLRGCIGPDTQGKPPGFRLEDFHIDMERQQATCPADHHQQRWVPAAGHTDNRVDLYIFFGKQCLTCPFFGPDRCTTSQTGRKLSLNTYHNLIQSWRQAERTEQFRRAMHARAAIEGTISELVRAHGLRRVRYRGASKVFLQAPFTTTAANLKRLARAMVDSFDISDFGHWYSAPLETSVT